MMVGTKLYLQCYLDWLSDKYTLKEISTKYGKSLSTVNTYIKYGRNIAITKYNKQFTRASKIKDEKQRINIFDEDLKKFLYPDENKKKFSWREKYNF